MNKNYLLTYQSPGKGYGTFAWFDTEDELLEFVDSNNVNVIEAFKISGIEILSE